MATENEMIADPKFRFCPTCFSRLSCLAYKLGSNFCTYWNMPEWTELKGKSITEEKRLKDITQQVIELEKGKNL